MKKDKEKLQAGGVTTGFADCACRLSASHIIIDGWCLLEHPTDAIVIEAIGESGLIGRTDNICWYERKDVPDQAVGFSAVIEAAVGHRDALTEVRVGHDANPRRLPSSGELGVVGNATERIFQLCGMLPAEQWADLQSWLLNVLRDDRFRNDEIAQYNEMATLEARAKGFDKFSANLLPSKPFMIDLCIRLDDNHLALVGWTQLRRTKITEMAIVMGDEVVPILDRCQWFDRPDVSQHFGAGKGTGAGFAAFVPVPAMGHRTAVTVRLTATNGFERELKHAISKDDPAVARRQLLSSFSDPHLIGDDVLEAYLAPSLEQLRPALRKLVKVRDVITCGEVCDQPIASIIVPVYHGLEFVTQQIVQFAADDSLRKHELIYILDSPESAQLFTQSVTELADFYDVPLKLIVLKRNVGFSGANNEAAKHAKGKYLLLLNQDVIPDRPGWLDRMIQFHAAAGDAACVGPKLLYEDHSIQHAGMYFRQILNRGDRWHNLHYFKGLHRNFPGASESRAVPAVTAACLLVERELYNAVEGLDDQYVMGDFEDSDFCLKCAKDGQQNYYVGDVELFHLERQSFGALDMENWRKAAQSFNLWRQSSRWSDTIQQMVQPE